MVAPSPATRARMIPAPHPPTVPQPLRAMGMRAVDLLLERIRRNLGEPVADASGTIVFPVEIVHRASVRPPRHPRPRIVAPV